jgi:glycosyltransferase involved in cell wall biosynthesis
MKILLFHQFYTAKNEAGIPRFNVFAKYWHGSELSVISGTVNYFTGKKEHKFFPEKKNDNISVRRVWSSDLGFGYRTFFGRLLSYGTFTISAFLAGLLIERPDVIIASGPPISLGLIAGSVSFLRNIPFVYEARDMWPDDAIELGFIKNPIAIKLSYDLEHWTYRRAELLMTNSPGIKKFLMERKGIPETKIGVVENPAESNVPQDRNILRKTLGWEGKTVFIYTGSHSFVYDFDTVLDAAKDLSAENLLFVFIGDGRQKPHLIERIEKENLKNVVSMDPVPAGEVQDYINAADAGFAELQDKPRLKFVYATKVFEYMAAGKPTILAMEGVTAELIEKSKSGIVVLPLSREEFKNAVLTLLRDEALREELGKNGRKYLIKNYRAEDLAKRYLSLLEPIIVPKG